MSVQETFGTGLLNEPRQVEPEKGEEWRKRRTGGGSGP